MMLFCERVQKTEQLEVILVRFKYSRLQGEIKRKYGTQDAFAEVIGMGRVSLNQRLNGKIEWSKDEMAKVMEALGLPYALIPFYFFEQEVQKTEQMM